MTKIKLSVLATLGFGLLFPHSQASSIRFEKRIQACHYQYTDITGEQAELQMHPFELKVQIKKTKKERKKEKQERQQHGENNPTISKFHTVTKTLCLAGTPSDRILKQLRGSVSEENHGHQGDDTPIDDKIFEASLDGRNQLILQGQEIETPQELNNFQSYLLAQRINRKSTSKVQLRGGPKSKNQIQITNDNEELSFDFNNWRRMWDTLTIPIYIDEVSLDLAYPEDKSRAKAKLALVERGLKQIENSTLIRFVRLKAADLSLDNTTPGFPIKLIPGTEGSNPFQQKAWIVIQFGTKTTHPHTPFCHASLGRPSSQHSIMGHIFFHDKCSVKTFVHEFIHNVGIKHTQSRYDRDKYIKIDWDSEHHQVAPGQFYRQDYSRAYFNLFDLFKPQSGYEIDYTAAVLGDALVGNRAHNSVYAPFFSYLVKKEGNYLDFTHVWKLDPYYIAGSKFSHDSHMLYNWGHSPRPGVSSETNFKRKVLNHANALHDEGLMEWSDIQDYHVMPIQDMNHVNHLMMYQALSPISKDKNDAFYYSSDKDINENLEGVFIHNYAPKTWLEKNTQGLTAPTVKLNEDNSIAEISLGNLLEEDNEASEQPGFEYDYGFLAVIRRGSQSFLNQSRTIEALQELDYEELLEEISDDLKRSIPYGGVQTLRLLGLKKSNMELTQKKPLKIDLSRIKESAQYSGNYSSPIYTHHESKLFYLQVYTYQVEKPNVPDYTLDNLGHRRKLSKATTVVCSLVSQKVVCTEPIDPSFVPESNNTGDRIFNATLFPNPLSNESKGSLKANITLKDPSTSSITIDQAQVRAFNLQGQQLCKFSGSASLQKDNTEVLLDLNQMASCSLASSGVYILRGHFQDEYSREINFVGKIMYNP